MSITAKKSYADGAVTIAISLRCRGWGAAGDSARIEASTSLTCAEARALAQQLVALADHADAKLLALKTASDARRREWLERQIAAGLSVDMDGLR